jgi:Gas vesicle synthesis protein GvpL/GvpF
VSDELDRIARAAVPEVVAAALDRARERAVDRLAELLTDAIVAQALAGAVPAAVRQPRPHEGQAQQGDTALYAYGITTAALPVPDDVEALTGDAPLRQVTAEDLALLVSAVHADQLRVDEDDLSETGRLATLARGHDAVVRAAALRGPVLPLRFGTVVPDEAAARRLLVEHRDSAREHLRRIGNAREWGVKLVRRLDSPVPVASRPRDRAGVTGTEYLARRRQALDQHDVAEAAAEQAADLLVETLAPHVTESLRRGGSSGSSLLLDLAVLVEADAEAGFLATAAELRQRLEPDALELEVSGPWPPYSFASLDDSNG